MPDPIDTPPAPEPRPPAVDSRTAAPVDGDPVADGTEVLALATRDLAEQASSISALRTERERARLVFYNTNEGTDAHAQAQAALDAATEALKGALAAR